jgi:F0F1-type ATP synthase membrane subunit a
MAGHTLLHILSTFALGFFKAKNWIIIAIFFVLLFLVSILEFGVAFLQAYVFVMLLSIYANDSVNLH